MVAAQRRPRRTSAGFHVALLEQLPCTLCEVTNESHAHQLTVGPVSLCGTCSAKADRISSRRQPAWFLEQGFDVVALTEAYKRSTGCFTRLNRILLAHKLMASKTMLERSK